MCGARAGDGPVEEAPGRAWAMCVCTHSSFCGQRERDASGKRAAPAHGAHARVVGGGRPRTGTPSFKMGCKPPPAIALR